MGGDAVDRLLAQWGEQRPEIDFSGLGLVVRIDQLAKLQRRRTAEKLAALSLKTWEYDVLSALRRQGAPFELPASALARSSLLTTGAMTTRIDQLENRGYVRRFPDPDDRRGVRVALTPEGLALVDRALEARLAAASSCLNGLDGSDRRALETGLRKLMLELGVS